MHPLQLVVNRQQLLADVIGVRKIRQRLQNIFQGSLCIDQQTAIGAAWLNSHGHNIVSIPFSDMALRTGVCTATDLKSLSCTQGSPSLEASITSQGRFTPAGADQMPRRAA